MNIKWWTNDNVDHITISKQCSVACRNLSKKPVWKRNKFVVAFSKRENLLNGYYWVPVPKENVVWKRERRETQKLWLALSAASSPVWISRNNKRDDQKWSVWRVFPCNFSIWKIFALQYDSATSFNNSRQISYPLCKWLLPFESSCYYTCEPFIFPRLKHSQGQVHLLVRFFHAHNSQWCTSNKEVYLLRGLLNAL